MGHSFKFKSVGKKTTDRKFDTKKTSKVQPVGIKTPVRNSGTSEIFDMNSDFREQIKDNLRNLILTNQGERLCRHDFGANLKNVLYDYSNDREYQQTVKNLILEAVKKDMPMISITDIQTVVLNDLEKNTANRAGLAKLKLRIIFGIPRARVENLAIEAELYIGG